MTQQTLPAMPLVRIEYYSNNSGGRDWLDADQWEKLRAAGWEVRGFDYEPASARPRYARKAFLTEDAARAEWEALTGMDSWEGGCPCCGPPHEFREE